MVTVLNTPPGYNLNAPACMYGKLKGIDAVTDFDLFEKSTRMLRKSRSPVKVPGNVVKEFRVSVCCVQLLINSYKSVNNSSSIDRALWRFL